MTKVVLNKLEGLKNHDKPTYTVRFANPMTISTEEVAELIQKNCTLKKSDIIAVITELGEIVSERAALGHSVRLDGLGIFTPMLTMDGVDEITPQDGSAPYLRTKNVHIRKIGFKVQKNLLENANEALNPTRSTEDGVQCPGTEMSDMETRKKKVLEFLEKNTILTIKEYIRITGMRRTMATRELKMWAQGADAILENVGSANKLIYVLKK